METCPHLEAVAGPHPPETTPGCAACLAIGQEWYHLRQCLTCGVIGCCDNSIGKHASAHAREAGHPTIRSAEPTDAWRYCFIDDLGIEELPSER
jgi:CPA1 family monovalent cation:H+ antiporter